MDPPYNKGIAEWDKFKNHIDWLKPRLIELERVLQDNGTMWFFHDSFTQLVDIHKMIDKYTNFKFKQFITIDKGLQSVVGRTSNNLRSFPNTTEYLLFYTFEDLTGSEQLSEKYSRINPMAKYLKSELERARVSNKEIAKLFPSKTGGLTGCVSNWLLGLNFPLKWQYELIRDYLNDNRREYEYLRREYEYLRREYEYLRREYEYLRREYEDLRYSFNLQKGITNVWRFSFYEDGITWHPTAKPIKLMKRIIKTATDKKDLVIDPFVGSGSSIVASQHLFRSCIGIEINPKYCEQIKRRCFGQQFLDREANYEFLEAVIV